MNDTYTYTVVLERDADSSGFVATCPALLGVVSEGETIEETVEMARDAVRGYLESLAKDGQPIPIERTGSNDATIRLGFGDSAADFCACPSARGVRLRPIPE